MAVARRRSLIWISHSPTAYGVFSPTDPTSWTGPAPAAPKPAPEGGAVDVTAAAELSTLVGDIIFEHPAAGSVAHRNGTTRVSTV